MEYRKFKDKFVVRLDKGEEVIESLLKLSSLENIKLARVSGLGATNKFTVGLFNVSEKKYYSSTYEGDFEIVSLTGTLSLKDGVIYPHIHMSAGDNNNVVYGGHLNSCFISATCEIVVDVIDGIVEREFNEEIGLNLFKFL